MADLPKLKLVPDGTHGGETSEAFRRPLQHQILAVPRLPIASDRVIFSLGCVYATTGLDVDLVHMFAEDRPEQAIELVTYFVDAPILLGVHGWENVVQSLPTEVFTSFAAYLDSFKPYRVQDGVPELYHIRQHVVPMPLQLVTATTPPLILFYAQSEQRDFHLFPKWDIAYGCYRAVSTLIADSSHPGLSWKIPT